MLSCRCTSFLGCIWESPNPPSPAPPRPPAAPSDRTTGTTQPPKTSVTFLKYLQTVAINSKCESTAEISYKGHIWVKSHPRCCYGPPLCIISGQLWCRNKYLGNLVDVGIGVDWFLVVGGSFGEVFERQQDFLDSCSYTKVALRWCTTATSLATETWISPT